MMTSVIRRPIGKAAGERLVAFAGLCRAVYFRLAAARRLPCIDCTSQGAETCGPSRQGTVYGVCKGSYRCR